MAAPHLKTTAQPGGSRRVLLNTGSLPKSQPKLKGANGQTIAPKTPAPKPAPNGVKSPAPAAKADEARAVAQAAAEQAAAQAAEQAAAEQAAAQAAAEAQRLAQEQYERELAEYNRQMEEYNRAVAAQQAAEAAAAAEAGAAAAEPRKAPAPAPQKAVAKNGSHTAKPATAKLTVAKPAATKHAAPKPMAAKPAIAKPAAAKPKHAPQAVPAAPPPVSDVSADDEAAEAAAEGEWQSQMSEEEYLKLQKLASKPPVWKSVPFWVGVGSIVALAIGCTIYVLDNRAEAAARKAEIDACNAILKRAYAINRQGVETLQQAKDKNVDITCSKADAKKLLSIIVDPDKKDDKGRPVYGARADDVAKLASLLLGIASEKDPDIDKLIFSTLNAHARQIKPAHYRWLLQRMAISNNKGINSKFRKLAENVSEQPKWPKKGEVLSYIWESMGLRVTKKDIPDIISLLKDDSLDGQLASSLSICLQNILEMTDDMEEKKKLGDEIFTALPDKHRGKMLRALGQTCSPKALAYYKERANDPKLLRADQEFFSNFHSDEIVPYLLELKQKAKGDEKEEKHIDAIIASVVGQNRDRSQEDVDKLLSLVFDKINVDTSDYNEVINKVDEDAATFVGKDSPEYPALKARLDELNACRAQKKKLITALKCMHNHKWVVDLLNKYGKDPDEDISIAAHEALEQVEKNTAEDAAMRAQYKSRDKN